ncbi:MAG: DUF3808 domain-containing protein [Calditrichaceae bacterium]|nr:DUF3808 domain-containing protein [Calditrichaceae bacterium]MBN2709770.1 DUF3808 domain-containing protein [Calditrichaceae bacterium]
MIIRLSYLMILFFCLSVSSVKAVTIDTLITKGLDFTFNMKFDEAVRQFDKLIARDPSHPSGYFMKTAVLFWKFTRNFRSEELGDEFEAVSLHAAEIAEKYHEKNKNDQDGLFYLGGIYGNLGRYYAIKRNYWSAYWNGKKGKNYLEDLVEINPQYYDAYLGLGIYHYYAATVPRFLKIFSFLLGIEGEKEQGLRELHLAVDKGLLTNNEARIFLSTIYMRLEHEYEKALVLVEELNRQYPNNSAFKISIGWVYAHMGLDDQALEIFNEILKNRDPDFQLITNQALFHSGEIYFKRNQFKEAVKYYKEVIENSKEKEEDRSWFYSNCLLNLGRTLEITGNREEAVKYYKQIEENYSEWSYGEAQERLENPYSPEDIKMIIAENYTNNNQPDRAKALLDELMAGLKNRSGDEKKVTEGKIHHYYGKIYLQKKKYEDAKKAFHLVLNSGIEEPEWLISWTHFYLAHTYRDAGNKALARTHYTEAMDTDSFRLKLQAEKELRRLGE